jgi:ligand-binding sensor protein
VVELTVTPVPLTVRTVVAFTHAVAVPLIVRTTVVPCVADGGELVKEAAVIVIELLVDDTRPDDEAVIDPLPAVGVTYRSVHVAVPDEAFFVSDELLTRAVHVFPPLPASVTALVAAEHRFPPTSRTSTATVPRVART